MFNKFISTVTVFILGIIFSSLSSSANIHQTNTPDSVPLITLSVKSVSDSLRSELVLKTNDYITTNFPKSKLTGEALVTACEKHDFDICFALAQAEIESSMGTAGKACKTNSPWNVGAWDSRSAQQMNELGYGHSHPDQSIEPYIELVKSKYLGNEKTINDLMIRYVTLSGHRYASSQNYEVALKRTYEKICEETSIRRIQEVLSILKG